MNELQTDVLVVGGGVGGCAAAMAAAALGVRVIVTEETAWLGGQLTSQAVPPDEHPWIETHGCTARYRAFRNGVRDYYRRHYPLKAEASADPHLNPGLGWVSRLCHEPRVAVAVIDQMLAFDRTRGRVRVLLKHRAIGADVVGDQVRCVHVRNLETGSDRIIHARFVLDATELGDLLPLTGTEYVSGAESQSDTGEPNAVAGPAQPGNVQALTWCFPLGYDAAPDADHVIDRPAQYDRWRNYIPQLLPAWPGRLLDLAFTHPITRDAFRLGLFGNDSGNRTLWGYRRIVAGDHYASASRPDEVTLVNWPQNDYLEGNIIDQPEAEVARCLGDARQLSLSLAYWLQTEVPHGDGHRQGYPGLYLCPEITGTDDGLAMAPYVRESRRILAECRVTENEVGYDARNGRPAALFHDSVGIGYYRIDLHPSTAGHNYIDVEALPFQIPLGALIPQRMTNLLAACKNIGVTHITNGCYRLHPVEWNIGESAGLLAAYCCHHRLEPKQVRNDRQWLNDFQHLLQQQGVELAWPEETIAEHLSGIGES